MLGCELVDIIVSLCNSAGWEKHHTLLRKWCKRFENFEEALRHYTIPIVIVFSQVFLSVIQ
jgi:hypothetical protein